MMKLVVKFPESFGLLCATEDEKEGWKRQIWGISQSFQRMLGPVEKFVTYCSLEFSPLSSKEMLLHYSVKWCPSWLLTEIDINNSVSWQKMDGSYFAARKMLDDVLEEMEKDAFSVSQNVQNLQTAIRSAKTR